MKKITATLALFVLGTQACVTASDQSCEGEACEALSKTQDVVYGSDNRKEYSDPGVSATEQTQSKAVGLLIRNSISCTAATCTITRALPSEWTPTDEEVIGLCSGEKFGPSAALPNGQRAAKGGHATGFLVAPDLVATAAHAISPDGAGDGQTCADIKIAFDYKTTVGGDAPSTVPAASVYSCAALVAWNQDKDVAVFRLDRAVTDRTPLKFRRTGKIPTPASLLLIGHPRGMPIKIARGGVVQDNSYVDDFTASVDAFHSNSGGPVFSRSGGLVEGIVSAGADDFTFEYPAADPNGCLKTVVCDEGEGCQDEFEFEVLARTTAKNVLRNAVPNQAPLTLSSSSVVIDATYSNTVGGDFDGDGISDILLQGTGAVADAVYYGKLDKTSTSLVIDVPSNYGVPLVGDYDGDGLSDVFWYNSGAAQDRIWWGQATRANFGTSTFITNATQNGAGYSPVAADFNGDGGTDIFWYGRGAAAPAESLWWSNKQEASPFSPQAQTIGGTNYYPVVGDFSGDGYADLFWFPPGGASGTMFWGQSNHSFGTSGVNLPAPLAATHRPFAGDFDGNGAVDILFYAPGAVGDILWWFKTDAPKTFTSKPYTISGTYLVSTGDFNGDSASDVLFYGSGAGSDSRWWGNL